MAAFAALDRAAARSTASGGQADARGHLRSRGQLMADALVERLSGQARAEAVPVEVQLVMPAETLAGLGQETAELFDGSTRHAPMAAATARALLATSMDADAEVWVRRLFTAPGGGELVALESRRRHFPEGLRRLLRLRDQTCRTPWCDAPIRHDDHVRPVAHGGVTSAANGQGLCESCNHAKEAPGWSAEVVADGLAGPPHEVRWRTPTGHEHHGTAPPILAGRRMGVSEPRPRRTATGARAG